MKRLHLLALVMLAIAMLISSPIAAQERANDDSQENVLLFTSKSPEVDRQGDTNVTSTFIDKVFVATHLTLVNFLYQMSPEAPAGASISMSSGTILKEKETGATLKIVNWGLIDDEGNFNPLNFNEQYSLEKGQIYSLFMAFGPINSETREISIYEDGGYKSLFWEGIHLEEPTPETLDITDDN